MLIKSAFSHFEEISILVKVGIVKVDHIEEHSRQCLVHIGPKEDFLFNFHQSEISIIPGGHVECQITLYRGPLIDRCRQSSDSIGPEL